MLEVLSCTWQCDAPELQEAELDRPAVAALQRLVDDPAGAGPLALVCPASTTGPLILVVRARAQQVGGRHT